MDRDLLEILKNNAYPGRGIVLGVLPGGEAAALYFIMGRSENSRNRVFTPTSGGIVTEVADPARMKDPSLILYAPVRAVEGGLIVTNGDQTDTVYDALVAGERFEDALRRRTFEPDAPNFTPRISGLLDFSGPAVGYRLSILKTQTAGRTAERHFFEFPVALTGRGHLIHTYSGNNGADGALEPFLGEPVAVTLPRDFEAFADAVWRSLDAGNRISLFAWYKPRGGAPWTRIWNRNRKREEQNV